jgi:hypothetical protein
VADALVPCQRWTKGRESYRDDRLVIDPNRHGVELIDELDAKRFLVRNHYAGSESYPATELRIGLYRADGLGSPRLVGALVFAEPQSKGAIPKWTGLEERQGTTLARLALLDEVEANGETWFLRRAFRLLQERIPDVRAVVSYSDPVARVNAQGVRYKPGHIGRIYKAHNGLYRGTTKRDDCYLLPDGQVFAPRSLSKLRNSERGAAGVERKLRKLGAPPRLVGESDRDYVYRLVRGDLFLRRRRRPGNHVYTWPILPLGLSEMQASRMRRQLTATWTVKPAPTEPDELVLGPVDLVAA